MWCDGSGGVVVGRGGVFFHEVLEMSMQMGSCAQHGFLLSFPGEA